MPEDLPRTVKSFSDWGKLQSVADGLGRLAEGQPTSGIDTKHFAWVGDLTYQMYWRQSGGQGEPSPELCLAATRLRPELYGAVCRFRFPWTSSFFGRLCDTLKSCGRGIKLQANELRQARQVYGAMASRIQADLQCTYGMGTI